jgi:hypothetical protein
MVTDQLQATAEPDLIARLLEQIRTDVDPDEAGVTLADEVLKAIRSAPTYSDMRDMLNDPAVWVDDVAQDTFERLLGEIRKPGYENKPIVNGRAYVRRVAHNICIDA